MKTCLHVCLLLALVVYAIPACADSEVRFGDTVTIDAGRTVDDAVSFDSDVHVYGTVRGNAVSVGGTVYVETGGTVEGDVVSVGGRAVVKSGGDVRGDVVSVGGTVEVQAGGRVGGERISVDNFIPNLVLTPFFAVGHMGDFAGDMFRGMFVGPFSGVFGIFGVMIGLFFIFLKVLMSVAIAMVFVLLMPERLDLMARFTSVNFLKALVVGFLVIVLLPLLLLGMLVSVLGIPFIPLFILFMIIVYFMGKTAVLLWVGQALPNGARRTQIMNVILGVLILAALRIVPFVGFLASMIISVTALGVVIMTRFGSDAGTRPVQQ